MTSEKLLQHLQRVHEANRGKKRAPEQCARISAAMKGRTISPEQRAKISKTLTGRPGHKLTPETKEKIRASRKTSPAAQAQLKALHEAQKGRPSWSKGKHFTEEHKKKIGEANRIKYSDPNLIQKLSVAAKTRCADPKYRQEVSERVKKYYAEHPEARAALSEQVTLQMAKPGAKEHLSKVNKKRYEDPDEVIAASERTKCYYKKHPEAIVAASERMSQWMANPENKLIGEKNHNWKGGISFEPYCFKFKKIREPVRKFFNGKCMFPGCGKTQEENGKCKVRLSVHHVFIEKMACCESAIEEMDAVRRRLPQEIVQYNDPEFNELEIIYIRMMVPLCASHHTKMRHEELGEIPYEKTKYRKFFAELIMNQYDGKCFK